MSISKNETVEILLNSEKDLEEYMQSKRTKLFKETGAFFCFSQSQFDEARKEGIRYASLGSGLICPKDNAKKLKNGLEKIYRDSIAQDMFDNGKKNIIWREFANHECQVVDSPADCLDKLEDYPITKEEILAQWKPYFDYCVENDLF